MKLWKKILLILLGVFILAQIPFVYNRCQIGQLKNKISHLAKESADFPPPSAETGYTDYRGVIHAHTSLGGHSTGHFDELIEGAAANRLDFVIMTEHTTALYDTSRLTLNGRHRGVLFVGGHELDTGTPGDRFLLVPGSPEAARMNRVKTKDFLARVRAENRLALVTYPHKFSSWETDFDGIEVYSLHTNAKQMNILTAIFDAIWSYSSYPKETFATYFERPDENLRKFDELTAKGRRITLFAGNDSHSNLGFHLFGDDAGNKLLKLKFDPYWISFGLVRTHILLEKDVAGLTPENLLAALGRGRAYIAFDVLSDADGFIYTARNGAGERKIIGDEIEIRNGEVELSAHAPRPARFVFFRNGRRVFESNPNTREVLFKAKEKGAYRVEVYLEQLGEPFGRMPWIISNPIYLK